MNTAARLQIAPMRVFTDSLIPTQDVNETLLAGPDSSHCGDPIPHAVLWGGELFIQDGHHRHARALRRGDETILVRAAIPFVHFQRLSS